MSEKPPKTLWWYGGKHPHGQLGKWIASLLPREQDVTYVEPFAGMLGVLVQRPQAAVEIANDLNENVVNWWRMVRDEPDELARRIALSPRSRAELVRCYEMLKTPEGTPMERATAFQIVVMQSMRHTDSDKSWCWSPHKNLPTWTGEEVAPLAMRLKQVQLECKDAVKFLQRLENVDRTVIYVDPPYRTANTDPYGKRAKEIDWDALTKTLQAQKGRVAVSGYRDEWNHLKWRRHHCKVPVNPFKHDPQAPKQKAEEALWTNY